VIPWYALSLELRHVGLGEWGFWDAEAANSRSSNAVPYFPSCKSAPRQYSVRSGE
jgi:hypothetical protein